MSLDPDFVEKLSGTLGNVLKSHLEAEQSPATGNDMALDVFINDFEDEFPRDPDDPLLGSYPTYSEEAGRAAREEPYGLKRGDRPKVWELNQPPPSRVRGWRVVVSIPRTGFINWKDCRLKTRLRKGKIPEIDGRDPTDGFQPVANPNRKRTKTLKLFNYRGSGDLTGVPGKTWALRPVKNPHRHTIKQSSVPV